MSQLGLTEDAEWPEAVVYDTRSVMGGKGLRAGLI
jgi:hypothetical protein